MEPLLDPLDDRVMKDLEPPPALPLADELLFPIRPDAKKSKGRSRKTPDWRALRDHFNKEGRVSKEHCHQILNDALSCLKKEPNLMKLKDPVTVVGDIHG
jgi:serine/threonine-protein phosphatase 2B catalytic subunit